MTVILFKVWHIACIIYYLKNGQIYFEGWCKKGEYHREDGPARIEYNENGQIHYKEWYLNGRGELLKSGVLTVGSVTTF